MVMQSFTASYFTSAHRYGLGYSNMNNYPETRYSSARRRYSRDYYPNVSSGYGGYGGMGGYGGGYGGMGGRSMGGYGGMGGYGRGGGY
jgi:peroxin-13